MLTTALTPEQLQNVEQIAPLDQGDPAAIWGGSRGNGRSICRVHQIRHREEREARRGDPGPGDMILDRVASLAMTRPSGPICSNGTDQNK